MRAHGTKPVRGCYVHIYMCLCVELGMAGIRLGGREYTFIYLGEHCGYEGLWGVGAGLCLCACARNEIRGCCVNGI